MWSMYRSSDPELMKNRDAKLYYEKVTATIWNERYKAAANYQSQQQTGWLGLGVFGNHGMLVEEYDGRPGDKERGLSYTGCGPGEIYILQNHQGRVDGFIRHFRWTAREAFQKWNNKITPVLRAALERADVFTRFDFLQFVVPRNDYDPMHIFGPKGKPWASIYVAIPGYCILEEGGYYSMPLAHGRYTQAPEEWYGRGPAQLVLPELKTKNTEKEAFLRQGKLAGDPFYLLPEDNAFDFKAESGAYNYGLVNESGNPLAHMMTGGNIQITKELMEDSDRIIDAAFLVDLFPLLFNKDSTQKSAREVIEVANQVAIFLAPTLGRQYGEYCATLGRREYDLLNRMGKLPEMPDVVKEANAGTHCQWTSPLARGLNSQGIAGYMRSVEMTAQVVTATGDQSFFDIYDFDTANVEIADMQYAPARWMSSPAALDQKRKTREQAAERDRQTKELPGRAAILKAQAVMAKAQTGGNIGGTLSGTPEGGMPQMPQDQGQQGQPGVFGQPGLPGRAPLLPGGVGR
jgi:hypothetical protein